MYGIARREVVCLHGGAFYPVGPCRLAHRAWNRRYRRIFSLNMPVGPSLIALLAVAEENLPRLSSARTFDPLDLLANLSGIAVFYGLDQQVLNKGPVDPVFVPSPDSSGKAKKGI